jgi:hemerythrin-like metal-binding protein
MRLFHWTRAKSVYIAELDAEHRNLYQIGEELHKACSAGADCDVLLPSVRALLAAAEDHFTHEERMMHAARYALLDWHMQQHGAARNCAKALRARVEAGDREAVEELLEFFSEWLKNHTSVADRMMAAALRAFARARAVA